MDVGLNNKNTLHTALDNEYLKDVEWIVEATGEEYMGIWSQWHDKPEFNWQEVSRGFCFEILKIKCKIKSNPKTKKQKKKSVEILPVMLSMRFAIVNGHKILFYTSDSRLTHHGYIEAFLTTHFQRTHDNYTRWNHTNATNVYNCLGYLNTIDIKPRDTKYKPDAYDKKYYIF